jgi:hypothetical protein
MEIKGEMEEEMERGVDGDGNKEIKKLKEKIKDRHSCANILTQQCTLYRKR